MHFNDYYGIIMPKLDYDKMDMEEDDFIDLDAPHVPPQPPLQPVRQDARINRGINLVPQPVRLFFNHPIALIGYEHDGDIDMDG
jgi:hypothetical protein